jgi:hypothetical protein
MLYVEAYYPHKNGGKDLKKLTPDILPEWVGREWYRDMFFAHVSMQYNKKMLYMLKTYNNRGEIVNPTFAGYDFLDEIRDPKWFAKIKKAIGDEPWTIALIRQTHNQLIEGIAKKIANTIIFSVLLFLSWLTVGMTAGIAWFFGFFG